MKIKTNCPVFGNYEIYNSLTVLWHGTATVAVCDVVAQDNLAIWLGGELIMAVMIKLRLPDSVRDFASVQALPGLVDLALDPKFGLVPLSPRDSLYAVRTDAIDNLDHRRRLSPEIVEAYGDVRISSTRPATHPE